MICWHILPFTVFFWTASLTFKSGSQLLLVNSLLLFLLHVQLDSGKGCQSNRKDLDNGEVFL